MSDEDGVRPLHYESQDLLRVHRFRRRLRLLAIFGAMLVGALFLVGNSQSIRSEIDTWRRQRTFDRAAAMPVGERFPPGEVVHALARSDKGDGAAAAERGADLAALRAELDALGQTAALRGDQIVFLGGLRDGNGRIEVVALGYAACWFHIHPECPDEGYFVMLHTARVDRDGGSSSSIGGRGVRVAPIDMLRPDPTWREQSRAVPLPLTFYGSYVDPNDPSVAVLPITFAEHSGEIRYSVRNGFDAGQWTVTWKED